MTNGKGSRRRKSDVSPDELAHAPGERPVGFVESVVPVYHIASQDDGVDFVLDGLIYRGLPHGGGAQSGRVEMVRQSARPATEMNVAGA